MRMSEASVIPVVCIVGPTGAGKTAASLHLAAVFDGAVINCDSRQVYKDFPVITAQPTLEEQASCPHHLYGFMGIQEKMSAGVFLDMARRIIKEEHAHGRLPLLVGGTGLYLRALLDGIAAIPDIPETVSQKWQERCAARGAPALHWLLETQDPQTAERLHPNDSQRIVRALEVQEATGRPLSWWHAQPVPPSPYRAVKIGVSATLDGLTPRLAKRIEMMLAAGALDEARNAMGICDNPRAPGWSGIGCAELYSYIKGAVSLDECKRLWLHNTRQYAKRQLTWFRREPNLHWLDGTDMAAMERLVHSVAGSTG